MTIVDKSEIIKLKNNKNRLLGLDVGTKTIGCALSDVSWLIATPLKTIERKKFKGDVQELIRIIEEYHIVSLVVGLPINMNGTEGPRCQSIRDFMKEFLKIKDISLLFWDERLSTLAVTRTLLEADMSRKRRSEVVDKMAAAYILQGFLDFSQR
jgi:putative Holliday junction resolvase